MLPDHYQALGVHPLASREEVRAAYLRLMRAHHPDRRPGDAASGEAARQANAAWQVLGDRARRAAYDRVREPGAPARHGGVRHVAAPVATAAPAYSPEGSRYRRAFHRACVRVAAAVFALGLVLLLTVA